VDNALVKSVELVPPDPPEERAGCRWDLPAIAALADRVALHRRVTYLIGENEA
jgi:predicted ATPase